MMFWPVFSDKDQFSWWKNRKRGLSGLTHRAIPGREDLNSFGFSPRTQMYWKRSFFLLIDSHLHDISTLLLLLWIQTMKCRCAQTGSEVFFSYAKTVICLFSLFCCCVRIFWTEPSAKVYAEPSLHHEVRSHPHIKLPYVLKDKIS